MYDTVPLLATPHSTGQYRKTMDKKSKKKIDVLRKRIEKMQRLLHDAKEQMDDPAEVDQLEASLAEAKVEIARLKSA